MGDLRNARSGLNMPPEQDDLKLMPRSVRDKLDRIGIKLHLNQWQQLSLAERRQLVDQACQTASEVDSFRAEVERLVRQHTGRAPEYII